jgi:hypothetical protein
MSMVDIWKWNDAATSPECCYCVCDIMLLFHSRLLFFLARDLMRFIRLKTFSWNTC